MPRNPIINTWKRRILKKTINQNAEIHASNRYQVSAKSIFDVIDLYAHVKRTSTPQIPCNVVEQTYLPVEKVLNFRSQK